MSSHKEIDINRGKSIFQILGAQLREGALWLILLLLAVLAFKIYYQFEFQSRNPLAQYALADEKLYMERALDLAEGRGTPDQVFHMAPLYPYLAAPVFALCGPDPMAIRLFQALVGTLSVLLLYLTARFFFSRPWALGAALAMALYYPFTFFEGKVLIATSAVFFTCLLLLILSAQLRLPHPGLALFAGLAAGMAAALRPNLLLAAPLVALWYLWAIRGKGRIKRCVLFLVGTALPILPFTLHNYQAEGDPVLLSDNGGINFYLGNNPSARGSFYNDDPIWASIEDQYPMARRIAEGEQGRRLKPSEVSRHWLGKGLDFARSEPLQYLKLLALKLKSFLENFEYAIIYTPSVERKLTPSLYLAFVPYSVFLCGAGLGLAALWLGRRREEGEGKTQKCTPLQEWAPALILVSANLLSLMLFFNYSRFRMTAIPAFILLGVLGCREGARFVREKKGKVCLVSILVAAVLLPLSLIPWGTQWQQQTAHGLATLGKAFTQQGDLAAAERAYTEGLAMKPDMVTLLTERGMTRLALENFSGARDDLEESVRLLPDYSPSRVALAEFYARPTPLRDLDRAARLIEEAARKPTGNPGDQVNALYVAGSIRMERGEYASAAAAYAALAELTPGQAGPLFLAGMALEAGGEKEKARACFEAALKIDPNHGGARAKLNP